MLLALEIAGTKVAGYAKEVENPNQKMAKNFQRGNNTT
jgi:hypothetical protein